MDSDSSISFKRCTILLLIFEVIFFISLFIGKNIIGYEVYINNKYLGCIKNKAYMKSVIEDLKNDFGERADLIPVDNLLQYDISIVDKNDIEKENVLKENLLNLLDNEVNVLSMNIDNKEVTVVKNEDEGNLIIENLKKEYISKYKLDVEKIKEINISNKIEYKDKLIKLKELGTFDNTYKNFLKNIRFNEDDVITTNIKIIKEENQPIVKNVVFNASNELYKGQSKTISEGEDGEKKVSKIITLVNGNLKEEKVISESVIKKPKEKIVQKGTKNPLNENIAFLSAPSRGISNITSNFGKRWGKNHNGIDIAGAIGDPIFAALDGVVSFSGVQNGYGNVIILKHDDNMQTIYAHCSKLNKSKGDKVDKGDEIALVGNTGRSTGPHLHFELRVNGEAKDPLNLIKK